MLAQVILARVTLTQGVSLLWHIAREGAQSEFEEVCGMAGLGLKPR